MGIRGKAFTQAEDDLIRLCLKQEKSLGKLAKHLGRGRQSMYERIKKMKRDGTINQDVMDFGQGGIAAQIEQPSALYYDDDQDYDIQVGDSIEVEVGESLTRYSCAGTVKEVHILKGAVKVRYLDGRDWTQAGTPRVKTTIVKPSDLELNKRAEC